MMDLNQTGSSKLFIILLIVFLAIGAFIGYSIGNERIIVDKEHNIKLCDVSRFKYINSQLGCSLSFVVDKRAYTKLKSRFQDFISEKVKNGDVSEVSIYFRDLLYGPTLGLEEHAKFSPASLLKLPLLLAYLNYSESDPNFLNTEIEVSIIENNPSQTVKPKFTAEVGKSYKIEELLNYMIKYSDNVSYFTLLDYMRRLSPDKDLLKETFIDLGIIDPEPGAEETISVKNYASIFVQLYHSSFLQNRELSENALTYLVNTDYKDGLNGGVPENITIAHKFGERTNFQEGGINQLHDCGIVYYPENPYIICVMTKGKDFQKLSAVISEISKMTYAEFDSRKLK